MLRPGARSVSGLSAKEGSISGGSHGKSRNIHRWGISNEHRTPHGIWIDFGKLTSEVRLRISESTEEPLDLFRTYYYDCLPWRGDHPTEEENRRYFNTQKFFTALRRIPRFDVREGRLQKFGTHPSGKPILRQKAVDLLLGMDVARLCLRGRLSHIALLSGDSDFLPVVNVAKEEGVSVWHLHGAPDTYADELRQAADDALHIDHEFLLLVRRE